MLRLKSICGGSIVLLTWRLFLVYPCLSALVENHEVSVSNASSSDVVKPTVNTSHVSSTYRTFTPNIVVAAAANSTTASFEERRSTSASSMPALPPEIVKPTLTNSRVVVNKDDESLRNSSNDNYHVSVADASHAENVTENESPIVVNRSKSVSPSTTPLTTSRTLIRDNDASVASSILITSSSPPPSSATHVESKPTPPTTKSSLPANVITSTSLTTSTTIVESVPVKMTTARGPVVNAEMTTADPSSSTDDNFDLDAEMSNIPEPTNPIVYFDFRRQCPEESAGEVWWNRTYGGVIAVRYCPLGYTGKVYRMCYYGGTWGDVDFSECRLQHLIKLKHLLFYHVHKNLTDGFHSLADELLSILLRHRLRSVDDYVESLDSLNIIINARVPLDFNLGQDFKYLKAILQISDILFSKFDNRWQFPQDQQDMVTMKLVQILHGMTHFGTLVAEGIKKSSRSLVVYTDYPHIGLEAKVIRGDEDYRISPPDTGSSVHLPARMYKVSGSVDKYVVVTMWYNGITSSLQENGGRVNSAIFATIVHPSRDLRFLDAPVTITLQISEKVTENDLAECGFLQRTFNRSSMWSRAGCTVSEVGSTSVTCICHHMTNVAVVVRTKHREGHAYFRPVTLIVFIGCVISLTVLFVTFVAHVQYLRQGSSESSLIVLNLIFAMMTAEVVFMAGIQATSNAEVCEGVSIVLHYVYLVSSFWLLSHGIHVFIAIRSDGESTFGGGHMKDYCLLSWIVPVVLVVITFAVNPRGYEIRKYCWLSIERGMLISYIVPIFCLITVNTVLMVLVLKHLFNTQVCMKKSDIDRARTSVRASVILLPYHGVHWFFGVLAMEDRSTDIFQTIFGLTTAVQGLLIFLFFGVLHAEVRKSLKQLTSMLLRRQKSSDLKLRRSRRRAVKVDTEPLLVVHESVMGGVQEQRFGSCLAARCLHGSEEPFIMSEERLPVS